MSEAGLELLAAAVRRLLQGGRLEEALEEARRAGERVAATLLDEGFSSLGLAVEYMRLLEEGASLFADAAALRGLLSRDEALLAARAALGFHAMGDGCILVRARRSLGLGRASARPGGLVCVEPLAAVRLAAAGLVEPVELLRREDTA